ncbi:hypothetical protein [Paramicrobacterium chengjingii]|uniref:Major facilitator superfamily (MFS) profile domain-containing protein n=1 Tax=Paramicrobacterium chengjingii TaxID=2769067 RepID=A0ABX6YII1_9MICO|nr:hypothetical protein [Microbacterium chengjingii]QPZ38618.1 hypothetical protein HCR76_00445 [Microbacterium chengjingii]
MEALRRYWAIMVIALPLGAVLGVVTYLALFASIGVALFGAAMYGTIGAVVALSAVLGALVSGFALERHVRKSETVRIGVGALGAAAGVFVLGVVVTIVDKLTSSGSTGGEAFIFVGTVLAIPASIVAAIMISCVEARLRSRSEKATARSWQDFNGL